MKKGHKPLIQLHYANGPSLEDINSSIAVPHNWGFWKTLFAYSGPGALVAVGYMDPGNWSTSITGGQDFGYLLMSVVLISSLIAMLLQYMAAKLGIVSQMDLAQAMRARTGVTLGIILWLLTEAAIMATDIAEVIGGAISLNLLFNIPLVISVFITVLDVLVLLLLCLIGFRKVEALVVCLILVILLVFLYQVILSKPDWGSVVAGLVPKPADVSNSPHVGNDTPLTGALGIVGATVMPHNLFLHSSISQTRKTNHKDVNDVARTVRFITWDSNIQLTFAFFVNAFLLITGVAVFTKGGVKDPSFFGLYDALRQSNVMTNPALAHVAKSGLLSTLFAVALLCSGQNSTITGTLTGQIIMEGFIHMKMPLWMRRLVTRVISVIPVLVCVSLTSGDSAIQEHTALNDLMNNSQVFLAFDLPFSMLPLLIMTDSPVEMSNRFKNALWVKICGWVSVIALIYLNLKSLPDSLAGFIEKQASQTTWAYPTAYVIDVVIIALLFWVLYDLHRGHKEYKAKHPNYATYSDANLR